MRENLNSYLEDHLQRGRATAFAHRRGLRLVRWSYARVARAAFRFARELEARGIGRGDRVLVWAANSPEWAAAFFGCAERGAVVVPLDVESAPSFVERVIAQTSPRLALVSAETKRLLAVSGIPAIELEEFEDVIASRSAEVHRNEGVSVDDLVEIIFTSGTTAEPRGVCLTHRNLLANLAPLEEEIKKYLRWERLVHPIRFLCLLPLSHVFGQFMGMFVPQILGGEVHFQDSLNPSEVVATIRKRRISVAVTVPRLLETLREHVERQEDEDVLRRELEEAGRIHPLARLWKFRRVHRRFGWKFWAFVSGGATLPRETETFWRRLGFAVLQGYGMTETASLIAVNHPFKKGRGSVGRALPGQEIKLDASGEILVRGPNVSPGYWREGLEPLAGEEGWLRTGDLGEMDSSGNIFFRGRAKDVIVTAAGLNIYPEDIEAALDRQPEILSSAVVATEGQRGPEPLAVVIMREEGADPRAAIERANRTLAPAQQVRRWFVWPERDFPRTPTHKVRKRDVLARVESAERTSIGDGPASGDEGLAIEHSPLASALAAHLSKDAPARLSPEARLSTDLKLDSLGRVELLSALEDRYQVEIDEAGFTAATTVGDIERLVREGGASSAAPASRYPYPRWAQGRLVRWFRVAFYYAVVLPITNTLCWVSVRGARNLEDLSGPALFVSNHVTFVDHALIMAALPGRFRRNFAIAQEGERLRFWRRPPEGTPLFRRLRWLAQYFLVVTIFNTFSLPQKSGFRRSFDFAGETVDRGYSVLVFPEGTRTEDGRLNPFMRGSGLLASQLGVPVVPVRVDGLFELKMAGRKIFAPPGSVTVKIGRPAIYARDEDPSSITADLERRVREL